MFSLYSCCLSNIRIHGYQRLLLGRIISVHETPEQLHGLENVIRPYVHKAMGNKWVKYRELSL